MKIYTGNFGNIKKYREAGLTTVSIARFNRWYAGEKLMDLAPTPAMIHDPEEVYTPKFESILQNQTPGQVFNKLENLSGGKDIVLLCYEKEGEFCHRHLVADWLKKNLNIEVKELGKMENSTLF